jgi:hypothetical protein
VELRRRKRPFVEKLEPNQLPGAIGTIKLPGRQVNGSSYMNSGKLQKRKWRAIRDNLRNFFLSPPAEMLSFFQQLRKAI